VNAEKIKYMDTSRDLNVGQNSILKIGNKSLERLEQFKYLGRALTYQNSIPEQIKSRLKSEECLLSFGAECFVFQLPVQQCKYNVTMRRFHETTVAVEIQCLTNFFVRARARACVGAQALARACSSVALLIRHAARRHSSTLSHKRWDFWGKKRY
jgi:hypothetical protein